MSVQKLLRIHTKKIVVEIKKYLIRFFSGPNWLDLLAAVALIAFQQTFVISPMIYQYVLPILAIIFTLILEIIRKSNNFLIRGIRIIAILYAIVFIPLGIKSINCEKDSITIPITSCSFSGIDCIFYNFNGTKCKSYYNLTKYGKKEDDVTKNYDVRFSFKKINSHIYKKMGVELILKNRNVNSNNTFQISNQ